MTVDIVRPRRDLLNPPSLVQLAADAVRKMIFSGELKPGERLIEERLTSQLGISRPPLREAMRILENEGLIVPLPRRGAIVATLTQNDVYEILTLRWHLERMAIELGVPVRDPALLNGCRVSLAQMDRSAIEGDRSGIVEADYAFHSAIIALPSHKRLQQCYASVRQQLLLSIAADLVVLKPSEDLHRHVKRHQQLFDFIEAGDQQRALAELAVHRDRFFADMSQSRSTSP